MADLSDFPYTGVQYGTDGAPLHDEERDRVLDVAAGATDVLVISHGWNNDMADARRLYSDLAASMREVLDESPPDGYADRRLAFVGVLWPSKKFAESDLIPGGAASVGAGAEASDVRAEVDALADVLDDAAARAMLDRAKVLVDVLEDDPAARRSFAELVRAALSDVPTSAADADAAEEFFDIDGAELMDRLARPVQVGTARPGSLTTGGAAGLGDLAGKAFRAARNLLNVSTYYQMKARAGIVGERGVAPLLADLRVAAPDVRIHLAGHSFGARVVTAAAVAGDDATSIASLSLLQAAFSHYGFAEDWEAGKDGLFRPLVSHKRVSGPTLVTHTANDRAVGLAYAIASRVAGQVAAGVGDADDVYGGLGRNGAQRTPEAVAATLLAAGADGYDLEAGRVHNLLADAYVSSHSDVTGDEVAYAVLSAIAAT